VSSDNFNGFLIVDNIKYITEQSLCMVTMSAQLRRMKTELSSGRTSTNAMNAAARLVTPTADMPLWHVVLTCRFETLCVLIYYFV